MKRITFGIALFCAVLICMNATAKPLLFMPFKMGSYWWCPQGNGGSYTHSGNLYWSFDFNKIKSYNSPSDPAYGQPIYAPLEGTIYDVVENVTDFQNNYGSNSGNNYGWGNIVLLKDDSTGKCLRICHFKKNSVAVSAGQHVQAGTYLGQLGMTGWSTNPHLHMHLQNNCSNSTSIPFAFVEGPVADDGSWNTWKMSELMPRGNVIDEDNSSNLGNYFSEHSVVKSGSWTSGTLNTGFVGDGYKAHQVMSGDMHSFTWNFKTKKPGYYVVFAKWVAHPNRDKYTKYTVFGKTVYQNQTKDITTGWHYLGWGYLGSTSQKYSITMQGTTPGKYVVADGIIVIKL